MEGQTVTQATLVAAPVHKSSQVSIQLALFNADGTPATVLSDEDVMALINGTAIEAQTDVGAVTSVVAAGATPTKAEFDALRVDALATRTVLNSFLAKARTAGHLAE